VVLGLCCAILLGPGAARAEDSPAIKGEPVIAGEAQEGATLAASATWKEDPPAIVGWAWLRCSESGGECQDIADAGGATYVPTAADVGRTLRVLVTWSDDDKQKKKRSAPTDVVLSAPATTPPTPVAAPVPVRTPSAPPAAPVTQQPQPRQGAAPRPAARLQILRPFPVIRIKGRLTERGARITLLTVRTPRGSQIAAACQGLSCPVPTLARVAALSRLRTFERELLAGTRLSFTVTRPGAIGKWTEILIRKGAPPRRRDGCLNSDTMRHRRCPS
jgi:hypothetical protein